MSQGIFSVETACAVCGALDFEKQSGYYICRNCDTQSQDIEEHSFDDFVDASHAALGNDEKEEIVSQKIEQERKLTSWECYNIILRGLVGELEKLGAQKRLRKTVFQLWALFLHKEQIAFFSKNEDQLPILPHTFKNRDVEVLYGIKSFRRMYLKDVQKMRSDKNRIRQSTDFTTKETAAESLAKETIVESNDSETDSHCSHTSRRSVRSLRDKQRKLAMSTLENDSSLLEMKEESFITLPENLKSLGVQNKRNSKNEVTISFRKSAVEKMEQLMKQFERIKRKYGNDLENIPHNIRSIFSDRIYGRSSRVFRKNMSTTQPVNMQLGINLLLAMLRLALLLIEDDIQWADIFRWSCEGHLSCFRVNKFLPENGFVRHTDLTPATRTHLINNEIRRLTGLLNIREIPTPNLFELVKRYTFELCLPREFSEFAVRIMAIFPPQMEYYHYGLRAFPDYECRVMGYILFVFKLLFSLDDVTEMKQSEFANTVNRRNKSATTDEVRLFSWTDWIRYMECRKAVLCKYNVTMNNLYESETSATGEAFLEFWRNTEPDTGDIAAGQKINKNLVNELEMVAKHFRSDHVDESAKVGTINFPSSKTPFRTYSQHLIEHHRELLSDRSHRVLSTDFRSYSIRYLLDPEWATNVATKLHLNVDPVFKTSVEMKRYEEPKSTNVPKLGSKNKSIPAHVLIPVRVLDDHVERRKKEKKRCREFHPEFKSFEVNSNEDGNDQFHFKLYHPAARYWFFHNLISKTCGEKFNKNARKYLPVSFLYLLRECSRILRCDLKNLYDELANIELVYVSLFGGDHGYSGESPFVFLPNEW